MTKRINISIDKELQILLNNNKMDILLEVIHIIYNDYDEHLKMDYGQKLRNLKNKICTT